MQPIVLHTIICWLIIIASVSGAIAVGAIIAKIRLSHVVHHNQALLKKRAKHL